MDLLPWFEWCESTAIGTIIRESLWLFPVVEAIHLIAFGILGGAVLLVDLRLLGLGLRQQPVASVASGAQPWMVASLLVMIASGTGLFLSEAVKCYYSEPFRIKMIALFLAVIFAFTVRRWVAITDPPPLGPLVAKGVALISVALWGTVAWGGRWIGFSG